MRLKQPKKANAGSQKSAAARRTKRLLIVPEEVMKGRMITIDLGDDKDLGKLRVDNDLGRDEQRGGYQRDSIKPWVRDLADAMRRGSYPDPVHLVDRAYAPDGCYWVVDGLQRTYAGMEVGVKLQAILHKCRSKEEEMALFVVLNDRKPLSASKFIMSYPGKVQEFLESVNSDPRSSWFQRVLLDKQYNGSKTRVQVGSLLLMISTGLKVGHGGNAVKSTVQYMETYFGQTEGRVRAKALVQAAGEAFVQKPSQEMLMAFAFTVREYGLEKVLKSPLVKIRRLKLETTIAASRHERVLLMARRIGKVLGLLEEGK